MRSFRSSLPSTATTMQRGFTIRRMVPRIGLVAAGLLSVLASSHTSRANWPPQESATSDDLKKPENWPNDPGYGYTAAEAPADRRSGQWNLFGFQPDRSPGASVPALRPDEVGKPSGVSADLAWRYTTGDPNVLIAVLDSGIRWSEDDLIEKAFLNSGELKNHKPSMSDGSACGGTGALAGFDCNGDGVLSVADYKDTPSLLPEASEGHPKGDKNNNGRLDAGDLIKNFSDGVDDDGNGYVDDISGWDFFKDDNDPFDDTDYGHGTGEARDSTAQGNNGIGDIGVCPDCRFLPLRVGDSFIADMNDFGQAVVYGVDVGASVIQEALGTINNTRFGQTAIEYAYRNNTIVIASMADENSRHHNVPGTNNYTLPVHAIVHDGVGGQVTTAKSMLSFNTCTNYGSQNMLSIPGDGCSSEATGKGSGMAGLLYSAARKYAVTPALTAGEVQQLFLMTADDINVPESQSDESPYYWSQKGFDQRFGYGRANINTAVEWVKDGKLPPEVLIVGPYWFENLYKGVGKDTVELHGEISAKRAQSYDYYVEWGPGVQPLESEFKSITKMLNVAPSVVTGGDGSAIATLDLTKIDPTAPADSDSPNGENKYTITVRIRVVAHYGGAIGDVPGIMHRAFQVLEDKTLLPGFPVRTGASGESSPKLADLDGDGAQEIITADGDGRIHAWKVGSTAPAELTGFPYKSVYLEGLETSTLPNDRSDRPSYANSKGYKNGKVDTDLARETFVATPAIGDLDGDGKPEIVATSWAGTIFIVKADGTALEGWPRRLPYVPSCSTDPSAPTTGPCMDLTHIWTRGAMGSPVLVDMNKDGKLDIVQAGFDGNVYVFDNKGTTLPGWPVPVHYDGKLTDAVEWNRILTTPSVADVDNDGIPEILVGSNEKLSKNSGAFYLLNGLGTKAPGSTEKRPAVLDNWPIVFSSLNLFPLVAEGVTSMGAFADFDGDGVADVIAHGNGSSPMLLPKDPGTQGTLGGNPSKIIPQDAVDLEGNSRPGLAPGYEFGDQSKVESDVVFPLFAQPSVGDLDMDGTPDVIASGGSLSLAQSLASGGYTKIQGNHLLSMWNGKTGAMLPGSPVKLEDFTFFNNQAIADVNGDGFPEVITGTGGYYIHAVDACGREADGFPKFTGGWIISTIAVGDVDGDGKLDVVTMSRDGWTFAWKTSASAKDGVVQWESFHHDNQNTGNYETKLVNGVAKKDVGTLNCSSTTNPNGPDAGTDNAAPTSLEARGGCDCSTAGSSSAPVRSTGAIAALLGLVAAQVSRIRRRPSPRS